MMGHRGIKKTGDEWDAFTRWRRYIRWKPGQLRKVKRGYNKRQRRIMRAELGMATIKRDPRSFTEIADELFETRHELWEKLAKL